MIVMLVVVFVSFSCVVFVIFLKEKSKAELWLLGFSSSSCTKLAYN